MENNFIELPISTRDGEFIAHYSEKGLAGLDFPKPNRRRRGDEFKSLQSETPHVVSYKLKSAPGIASQPRLEIRSRRTRRKKTSAARLVGAKRNSSKRLARDAKISSGKPKATARSRRRLASPSVRAVGGACGAESGSGFGFVPPHSGREQKNSAASPVDWIWKRSLLKREGINLIYEESLYHRCAYI